VCVSLSLLFCDSFPRAKLLNAGSWMSWRRWWLWYDVWNRTYYPKAADHENAKKQWYIVDASDKCLGRLASTVLSTSEANTCSPTLPPLTWEPVLSLYVSIFCHHDSSTLVSFLQPQLWTLALLTDFWPKLSKLSKGHCKWISIWCVLNTFRCISVSLWKFCPWWNGTWFEHGCFLLWQCVKIDHVGECWESGSYKQEKVTGALQVALWQARWDDWGDFWFFAAPNSWMNYWACSARHVTKRPGGHLSLSFLLCAHGYASAG
jgi:hypothetical protein